MPWHPRKRTTLKLNRNRKTRSATLHILNSVEGSVNPVFCCLKNRWLKTVHLSERTGSEPTKLRIQIAGSRFAAG
jgi:hypothetical protein